MDTPLPHTGRTSHQCRLCHKISLSTPDPKRYNWNCPPFGVSVWGPLPVHLDPFWMMSNQKERIRIHRHLKTSQIKNRKQKHVETHTQSKAAECQHHGSCQINRTSAQFFHCKSKEKATNHTHAAGHDSGIAWLKRRSKCIHHLHNVSIPNIWTVENAEKL